MEGHFNIKVTHISIMYNFLCFPLFFLPRVGITATSGHSPPRVGGHRHEWATTTTSGHPPPHVGITATSGRHRHKRASPPQVGITATRGRSPPRMGVHRHEWASTATSGRPPQRVGIHRHERAFTTTIGRPPPGVGVHRHEWASTTTSGHPPPRVGVHCQQLAQLLPFYCFVLNLIQSHFSTGLRMIFKVAGAASISVDFDFFFVTC